MVDRERDALRDDAEQVDLLRPEIASGQRADVDHPEHPVVDDQRRAGERLDAAPPENRVDDVGTIEVLDHHRAPLGHDLAREAAPDWDPNAGLHLLLEPLGGARDELGLRLVE